MNTLTQKITGGTKMKLSTKLLLAFLLLVVMIAGAGTVGLLSMKQIEVLSNADLSSPLLRATSELIEQMKRTHIDTLQVLSLTDAGEIQKRASLVDVHDRELAKKRDNLAAVIKQGRIQMDMQTVTASQQQFMRQVREMFAAHLTNVGKEAAARQKLEDFEKRRVVLDAALVKLSERSEAAINEQEDRAKTLGQSGKASVSDLSGVVEEMFDKDFPLLQGALKLQRFLMQLQETARAHFSEQEPGKLASLQGKFEQTAKDAEGRIKKMTSRARTADDKKMMSEIASGFSAMRDSVAGANGLFAIHRDTLKASADVVRMQGLLEQATRDSEKVLAESFGIANRFSEAAKQLTSAGIKKAKNYTGLFIILGIVFGLGGGWMIARSITKPIDRMAKHLRDNADLVAAASEQVSTSSLSLSEGATEQAASLEEIASSLDELSSMTRKNAENASLANDYSRETKQVISRAQEAMERLKSSMSEITEASAATSKIVKTIDGIAFQTNLLALNAAVEAARAGEAGAGFAVVADEVRKLALRSTQAAKDTSALIEGTVVKVRQGAELVEISATAFCDVATSAEKISCLVGEITAASDEQAQGIAQLSSAMNQVDKVTQSAAASAEESSRISQNMNHQADDMKGAVDSLASLIGTRIEASGSDRGAEEDIPSPVRRRLPAKAKSAAF